MGTVISYLYGMWVVCTQSWASVGQCVRVWEYMPGYVRDYVEFVRFEPYYAEKEALKK